MCCLKTPSVIISGLLTTIQFKSVDTDIRKYTALEDTFQCSADDLCNAVPDDGTTVMKHVACSMFIAVCMSTWTSCRITENSGIKTVQLQHNTTHKYT